MVSIEDISKLEKFINIYLPEPSSYFPSSETDSYLYSRWIADSILDSFLENSDKLPEFLTGREFITAKDIVYEFESYFDSLASVNSYKQNIFISALETIHMIINYLFY